MEAISLATLFMILAEPMKTYDVGSEKNIAYVAGDSADKLHKLDLYYPKDCKDYPVLFFIHGGAWTMGGKNDFGIYESMGKVLAKQGIGMVSIDYRLSPKVKHPAHIEDAAAAFAWVHANIGKYGGSKDRLAICGHSAGGHLCALLATDETYLKKHNLDAKAIKAVVPISGVFFMAVGFMKEAFGTDAETVKKAAPAEQVRAGLPPFLILYADKDLPGCGSMAAEGFCKLLKAKNVDATAREFKESNHLLIMLHATNPEEAVFVAIRDFVLKHAK